ncbi:hypothetical protein AB433_06560 [Croceicoccus naphthovorans]|uniref:Uncharacterized protein n=1 Tax=Croceicoccus naphthovorans TaxID=1348774 RepID=A0A0G3XET8_9SPHN|nr:hypothetical protein AB433_06560 [Croceicoccus naphthovorans]
MVHSRKRSENRRRPWRCDRRGAVRQNRSFPASRFVNNLPTTAHSQTAREAARLPVVVEELRWVVCGRRCHRDHEQALVAASDRNGAVNNRWIFCARNGRKLRVVSRNIRSPCAVCVGVFRVHHTSPVSCAAGASLMRR